jgi:MFS family permease
MATTTAGSAGPERGWVLVLALAIGQLISWGTTFYTFPLVIDPMIGELGWARTTAYMAPAFGLIAQAICAPLAGFWMQRHGGRLSMTVGSLGVAVSILAWSAVDEPWQLMAAWVLMGVAQAFVLYEPAFTVVAQRKALDFRRSVGAITLLGGLAGTVFVPGTQLLVELLGWRQAVLCLAAINLAVPMILHALLVPSGNGGADSVEHAEAKSADPPPTSLSPRIWLGLALWFTAGSAYLSGISFHFVPLLAAEGIPPTTLAAIFAIVGPSQLLGRACLMALGSKATAFGAGLSTVSMLLVSSVMLWALPHSTPGLIAFGVVYGAGNGIMTIARGIAIAEVGGRARYAALTGILQTPAVLALALAPVIVSLLRDAGGADAAYAAFLTVTVLAAAGFAIALLPIRPPPAT